MDCSPRGSSVYEILQARILEWDAIPSSHFAKHLYIDELFLDKDPNGN